MYCHLSWEQFQCLAQGHLNLLTAVVGNQFTLNDPLYPLIHGHLIIECQEIFWSVCFDLLKLIFLLSCIDLRAWNILRHSKKLNPFSGRDEWLTLMLVGFSCFFVWHLQVWIGYYSYAMTTCVTVFKRFQVLSMESFQSQWTRRMLDMETGSWSIHRCCAAVMRVSVADNDGNVNILRFALSIKMSLKRAFKPLATCTSLASYITKHRQWGSGASVCVCVNMYVSEIQTWYIVSTGTNPQAANLTHHLC